MISAVATALLVAFGIWAIGEGAARSLFGKRYASVATEMRLLLGLACATLLLEGAGYFVSVSVAGWLPVLVAVPGAVLLARRGSSLRAHPELTLCFAVTLLLGLLPVLVVGRFTAAAMTNNDATYYLAAADRLLHSPWSADLRDLPDSCLNERLIRGWYWRTGTSNLIAAVTAVTRLPATRATTVVTLLLMTCVPAPALSLARRVAPRVGKNRLALAGALASVSAVPLFLGYQHLLGQLAAYSLFPAGCAAALGAFRRGGVRRIAHAAVLLGAGVAHFADASSVLVAYLVLGVVVGRHALRRTFGRALAVAGSTALIAPFTLGRAAIAALLTLTVRVPGTQAIFPQRGWIDRPLFDHITTVLGVDAWPPWPSWSAPVIETVLSWVAVLAGCGLVVVTLRRAIRFTELRTIASVTAVGLVAAALLVRTSYVVGKAMLLGAAFVVPAVAAAPALARAGTSFAAVLFLVGELACLAEMMRPSRWTVVDRPDHDQLVPELRRVPAGSLLMLDGFGAPADAVLDAHRAYRAAQLAGLVPIHAGLDGGFYRPRCADPPRPDPPPHRAFVLARRSSEELSVGKELAAFGRFRLLTVDLDAPGEISSTWAPTHGFLAAETEPGRGVFRWAGAESRGTLRALSNAPCVRLAGEMRTTGMQGAVTITSSDVPVFAGYAGPDWAPFRTSAMDAVDERVLGIHVKRISGVPLDAEHVIATRALHIEKDFQCASFVRQLPKAGVVTFPFALGGDVRLELIPAVGIECGDLAISVVGSDEATLGVSFDGAPVEWHALVGGHNAVTTETVRLRPSSVLRLFRRARAPEPFQLEHIELARQECKK